MADDMRADVAAHPTGAHDIELSDVSIRYGRSPDDEAIRDMSVRFEAGVIHGLLGRNGSGKTSLLSAVAGFRPVNAGTVTVGGQTPFENSARTEEICLIRESGTGIDTENVDAVLGMNSRWRPYWDPEYADHLIGLFDLPRKKQVRGLSRGSKSALGVIVGLASRAPVTIFDEAYLGLDAPSRYAFYDELISDYAENPRTIIVSTHLIEEVARLFEQVTIIDHGRLVLQGSADELGTRGTTVTGPNAQVEQTIDGHVVLSRQHLGGTTAATIDGRLSEQERHAARSAGLELGPVGLQDLFIHLTSQAEGTT